MHEIALAASTIKYKWDKSWSLELFCHGSLIFKNFTFVSKSSLYFQMFLKMSILPSGKWKMLMYQMKFMNLKPLLAMMAWNHDVIWILFTTLVFFFHEMTIQALLLKRFEGIETITRHFKSIMTILKVLNMQSNVIFVDSINYRFAKFS